MDIKSVRIMPEDAPITPATRCVFVYGTLRRGGSNDITRLAPSPRFLGTAQVAGVLYHLGAYPGLVLGGPQWVQGEVYGIAPALEQMLDEIEEVGGPTPTDEYFKREILVHIHEPVGVRLVGGMDLADASDGRHPVGDPAQPAQQAQAVQPVRAVRAATARTCLVYEINPRHVLAAPVIANGDWLQRV